MNDGDGTRDPRIREHEPLEVTYWAAILACTEAELREAIDAVGTDADAVRQYLSEGVAQP